MERTLHLLLFLVRFSFLFQYSHVCMGCRDEEKQALLIFQNCYSFQSENSLHYIWKGSDCCRWKGVGCSNKTGHVESLSIPNALGESYNCPLSTSHLDYSLSSLKYLQHLDLSYTNFDSSIPQSIASLAYLRYLDLSRSSFSGIIPPQVGNLTNLQHLDMKYSSLLRVDGLQWLSHLSSLQYLDLSDVDLSEVADWSLLLYKLPALRVLRFSGSNLLTLPDSASEHTNVSSVATLDLSWNHFQDSTKFDWLLSLSSSLVNLNLASCEIQGPIPYVLGNLSSLVVLQLDYNRLNGTVPESLGNLTNLEILDLSHNSLQGPLPGILGNMCKLKNLDFSENKITGDLSGMLGQPACKIYNLEELNLSGNKISGGIPDLIGEMKSLKYIFMYDNFLNGSLPVSLGQLSELVVLGLTSNSMQGVVSHDHFSNLTSLKALYLSSNSLTFNISSTWLPPFQLQLINLRSCPVGPQFPSWLQNQRELSYIDISHAGISDVLPTWLWNVSSQSSYLNVSKNQIYGEISASHKLPSATIIDLSTNLIQGRLPHLNSSVVGIFLYENLFSGDVQPILDEEMRNLQDVVLSRNSLTGEIPLAFCKMEALQILDLSYNNLTGEIPRCQIRPNNYRRFSVINFASNSLHGLFPQWIVGGIRPFLQILNLSKNNFQGKIPSTLRNCSALTFLDLGDNKLTGNIPTWIGEIFNLRFLRLRANRFTGTVPSEMSYLPLQFLDLGQNYLSGTIPRSFTNLSAMQEPNTNVMQLLLPTGDYIYINNSIGYTMSQVPSVSMGIAEVYEEMMRAVMKGKELEYSNTITLVMLLDLSCNRLTGEVPIELMNLVGLQSLNLSQNQLTGKIPDKMGDMIWLETLDLSVNHLSGAIPGSMSFLTKLSHLNLSYNNLSGRIPSGNQLQTLTDTSIYVGNRDLCGFPLPKRCPGDEPSKVPLPPSGAQDDDNDSDMSDLYFSMGLGYAAGLWSLCGIFIFKNTWRIAYFRFFDEMAFEFSVMKETLRRLIFHVIQG